MDFQSIVVEYYFAYGEKLQIVFLCVSAVKIKSNAALN